MLSNNNNNLDYFLLATPSVGFERVNRFSHYHNCSKYIYLLSSSCTSLVWLTLNNHPLRQFQNLTLGVVTIKIKWYPQKSYHTAGYPIGPIRSVDTKIWFKANSRLFCRAHVRPRNLQTLLHAIGCCMCESHWHHNTVKL